MWTLGTGVVHILWYMPPCCSPVSSAAPTLGHAPSFLTWTRAGASWQTSCCPPCPYSLSPHSSPSDLVKSEIGSMPPPCLYPPPQDPHRTYNQGQSSYLDFKALWCLVLAASWKPAPARYPGLFLPVEHRRSILTSRPLHWLLLWSSPDSFFPSQLRCQLLREASPPVYRDWGAYRSTTVIHKMHVSLNMLLKAPWVWVIGNFFPQFTVVRESVWH